VGDVEAFVACLSPEIVVHSPITDSAHFEGLEEVRRLMTAVFATFEDVRYFEDFGDDRTRFLAARARVNGVPGEEAFLVRLDDAARISDITIFIRPLPALTSVVAMLGPELARIQGPRRGATALAAMSKPLAFLTRTGDKLGTRLAGMRSGR
jgi:hypothetical protein